MGQPLGLSVADGMSDTKWVKELITEWTDTVDRPSVCLEDSGRIHVTSWVHGVPKTPQLIVYLEVISLPGLILKNVQIVVGTGLTDRPEWPLFLMSTLGEPDKRGQETLYHFFYYLGFDKSRVYKRKNRHRKPVQKKGVSIYGRVSQTRHSSSFSFPYTSC